MKYKTKLFFLILFSIPVQNLIGQDINLSKKGNLLHSFSLTFSYLFEENHINAVNFGIAYDLRFTYPFGTDSRGFAGMQLGYHIPFRHIGDFVYTTVNHSKFGDVQDFYFSPYLGIGAGKYRNDFITKPQLCNSGFPSAGADLNDFSLTLATNLIWLKRYMQYDEKNNDSIQTIHIRDFQRVGGLVLKARNISLGYSNDGPAFDKMYLADQNKDRYWTGSGYIDINFKMENDIYKSNALYSNFSYLNHFNFKWGFDRFTSDNTVGYKIGTFLGLNYLEPKNDYEALLNAGCLYWKLSNLGLGAGFEARTIGTNDLDIQDFIHNISSYSKHIGLGKNRFVIGPVFESFVNFNQKIK